MMFLEDWKPSNSSFPSAIEDARCAVDCWAMGQWTASVFHSMRLVECGLNALAKDLEVDFGVDNWQNVIDRIESGIKKITEGAK